MPPQNERERSSRPMDKQSDKQFSIRFGAPLGFLPWFCLFGLPFLWLGNVAFWGIRRRNGLLDNGLRRGGLLGDCRQTRHSKRHRGNGDSRRFHILAPLRQVYAGKPSESVSSITRHSPPATTENASRLTSTKKPSASFGILREDSRRTAHDFSALGAPKGSIRHHFFKQLPATGASA